jgi:hypothetical protein
MLVATCGRECGMASTLAGEPLVVRNARGLLSCGQEH